MKLIIAGSRDSKIIVEQITIAIEDFLTEPLECVVSGSSGNVDKTGETWARYFAIPAVLFPVFDTEWRKHGKKAGPMRNARMADYADAALIFWDGKSPGAKNMAKLMKDRNKPHWVIRV